MVKHREKNTFHFQSFNDQLCGIKVGVRRLSKIEDCGESGTQLNQALQTWRELNCSEQFVVCYGKLNPITESVAQLLHHRDEIVSIILGGLESPGYGADALLDLLSNLALDIQEEFYCCFPRILPVFHTLLRHQDASLISHVFKTLAHIFKTTWRQMLLDLSQVFSLLTPLLKPPSKHYVTRFAAESFAYLIRKHNDPVKMLEFFETVIESDGGLVEPLALLLFETVKGVQYTFNVYADRYLQLSLYKATVRMQELYTGILRVVVQKITKLETQPIWTCLLAELGQSDSKTEELGHQSDPKTEDTAFLLDCIDILLEGGRHTYLISSDEVYQALYQLLQRGYSEDLSVKLGSTTERFIVAHNKLLRYLKQVSSNADTDLLLHYIKCHKSAETLRLLVTNLFRQPEFFERYCRVIFNELQLLSDYVYVDILAEISIQSQVRDTLEIPQIFGSCTEKFLEHLLKILSESTDRKLSFSVLKVLQSCSTPNTTVTTQLHELLCHIESDTALYLETLKCIIATSEKVSLREPDALLVWDDMVALLQDHPHDIMVVQTIYLLLKKCDRSELSVEVGIVADILKGNMLITTTPIRYISLQLLSLLCPATDNMTCDISAALNAEVTPLTLETFRDKLMYCSQIRYSGQLTEARLKFRIQYLLGCLQWSLQPIWAGLTKLLLEFAENNPGMFWQIFSEVLQSAHTDCETASSLLNSEQFIQDYVRQINSSDFSKSGSLTRIAKQSSFRLLLWRLLSGAAQVAEPKSRFIVPFILEYRDKYNAIYGFKKQNVSEQKPKEPATPKKDKTDPDTHMNDELRSHLQLLSQFNNPKALYRTKELYEMHLELVSSKQSDIQKLALDCLLTYKDDYLIPYKEQLALLVDDVTFRDQLAKCSFTSEDCAITAEHRPKIFPVIIRLLFGKMSSRIGHAKGKSGSKQRQGIVLRFLEACSNEEVTQFLELVSKRFGIDQLDAAAAPSFTITPLGMQTSYLKLLRQTLSVLRSEQTTPHVISALHTVLTLLHSVQHCLQHRAQLQQHTLTPLKALRALAVSTVTLVFNTFPVFDFTSARARLYEIVVDPSMVNLPSESLQACAPLLLLIESWSTCRLSWLQHTCAGRHVLFYVFSLLRGKGVVSKVISKVLTIATCLLDGGEEGISVISPFVHQLVDYIYGSLVNINLDQKKKKKSNLAGKKKPGKMASRNNKTLKQELDLLSRLTGLVQEVELCGSLVRSLLHVLEHRVIYRPADVVNATDAVTNLMMSVLKTETDSVLKTDAVPMETGNVPTESAANSAAALLRSCYDVCYGLLGRNNDRNARLSVCRLLQHTEHPCSATITRLHAWNANVLDEPDFDERLQGYRDAVSMLKLTSPSDDLRSIILPCLNTACYTIFTSDEMALRDSASYAVLQIVEFISSTSNRELYTATIPSCLVHHVQSGLRNASQLFRHEAIILLHKVIRTFPDHEPWDTLVTLTDTDPETDFFENIRHIQAHRRTRAVVRLRACLGGDLHAAVVGDYLLPLIQPIFALCGNKHHNTVSEALSALTEMCHKLPWIKYHRLLQRYLSQLTENVGDKTLVKVVGAVLTGFHESVLPGSKILRILSTQIIPKLVDLLTKKTNGPIERSNKKSIVYEEDQVAVQAPIAIAIVSLITRLPDEEKQTQLPPVLLRICNTLRNRAMDVRNVSRQTLSSIAKHLGPLYFGYILSEMRGALFKGYQLHVLSYTLHHLLINQELQPAQIDNHTLAAIMEICVDGLVGRTAADRDRGDDKKHSLPEAKKCYSSPCIERCVSVAAVSQLDIIMEPVKKMVLECTRSKTKLKLEDVLKGMVKGVLQNTLITPTVVMVFCHKLLNSTIDQGDDRNKKDVSKKLDIYEIPEAPKREGVKPKVMHASNVHLLHDFSLQILSTLLKRNTVSTKQHGDLLDPFIDCLSACLSSPAVRTQVLALRCLAQLYEQPLLLPRLCDNVKTLTSFAFNVLRNHTKSTNSGHMMELIFSSFKILTVILREYTDYNLSDLEIKALLQYIADDIHNRNRQATAFSLLKSILSRDIVVPEIPELLERIFEISITGQSDFVRTQSRQVFLQYLIHYPIGKKLRVYLISLTKQLEYTHRDGRMSALELLDMIISKLPKDILKEYSLTMFLSLSTMLVSDDNTECRKAAGLTIGNLLSHSSHDTHDKVLSLTATWLQDRKLRHKYLAVQLVDITASVMSPKKCTLFVELLVGFVNTYCGAEDESGATTTRDQILYTSILTLLKFSSTTTLPASAYDRLLELLSYPHQWVRLASSQLLGHLLSLENSKTALTAPKSTYFSNNPRSKINNLIKSCLIQLKSPNILAQHSNQIVKNIVWLTTALFYSDTSEVEHKLFSLEDVIHKLVRLASVESSQDTKSSTKRVIILKWIGALVNSVEEDRITPHLPVLLTPLQREIKSTNSSETVSSLAVEVMSFLREKLGKEVVSVGLVAADKASGEKKRKRKRDAALQAIVQPEKKAKLKVKVNLAKREKRKEKYKLLKAKQFKSL